MTMLRLAICLLTLSGAAAFAAADSVPSYNVEPGCRSVARSANAPTKDAQACIEDEYRLRDELKKEWPTFSVEDRVRCTRRLSTAWRPTYTELATCLEIARAVRELPEQLSPETVRKTR